MSASVSSSAEVAREQARSSDGRFGAQPAAESQTRLDSTRALPDGVRPDPATKGLRGNKVAYRLERPVTWTEPSYRMDDRDERPPATREFDRVAVSYSTVDAEVLVLGVVNDRPSFDHVIWDGLADDDADTLARMYEVQS